MSLSARRGLIAATLTVARGVGSGLAGDGGGLLERGLQVERLRQQDAGGAGTELDAGDVLRHREVLLADGAALGILDADGEDGQVVNLHVLALQEQFADTVHHVGEQPLDDALRIGSGSWGRFY